MRIDRVPRYTPGVVWTIRGKDYVTSATAHPPGSHPEGCPLVPECTALELKTEGGFSRFYGVEKAYINSRLRMVVVGFPAAFEEMAAWARVPRKERA